MKRRYDFQTEVSSFTDQTTYKISFSKSGAFLWSCSCPHWKFKKNRPSDFRCKHIRAAVLNYGENPLIQMPEIRRRQEYLKEATLPQAAKISVTVDNEVFLVKRVVRSYAF